MKAAYHVLFFGKYLLFLMSWKPKSNCFWYRLFFTALHEMQMRSSDENSVHLSKARLVTKWKKDRSRFLYHTKDHLA